jgi:hypothetical protein
MKRIFLLFALFLVVAFSCTLPEEVVKEEDPPPVVVVEPPTEDVAPEEPEVIDYSQDPRVKAFDAISYEWINYPVKAARSAARGIKKDKETLAKCNKTCWNYIFFDDEAVIGYEPPEGRYDVMLNAVKLTVESHNMEFPDKQWDYYTNPPPPPPPPVTSKDPVLGHWQSALCTDDGHVVLGPYTAEFDFNWAAFKTTMPQVCESYNLEHPDDKAHVVWGTD